jgi:hypothetical protein
MKKQVLLAALALTLVAALAGTTPAAAGTAPRDPNLNGGVILGPVLESGEWFGEANNWIDHFDTYVTGSTMAGQGGWTSWDNAPAADAPTSSAQARTAPNSVLIQGTSDLVHTYTGYTTGTWTFTAYQYVPSALAENTYFILLNRYEPGGTNNWSTQVCFDTTNDLVRDDPDNNCAGAATLPLVYDQWVQLRVVIDLDNDSQTFFYNGQQLYNAPWIGHISAPTGAINQIGAVDLWANLTTSPVYYDDISLSDLDFFDGFETGDTREWHFTQP